MKALCEVLEKLSGCIEVICSSSSKTDEYYAPLSVRVVFDGDDFSKYANDLAEVFSDVLKNISSEEVTYMLGGKPTWSFGRGDTIEVDFHVDKFLSSDVDFIGKIFLSRRDNFYKVVKKISNAKYVVVGLFLKDAPANDMVYNKIPDPDSERGGESIVSRKRDNSGFVMEDGSELKEYKEGTYIQGFKLPTNMPE